MSDDDEGRAPKKGPGLLSWIGAGVAVLVAAVVLWMLAAPKQLYDPWWESQAPGNGKVSHEDLARTRANVFHVRSVRTKIRGDSLYVHPMVAGQLEGSYRYRCDVTVGFNNFAVASEEGVVRLPDELAELDSEFALSVLDSAYQAGRSDSLTYQVRFRLDPGYLFDAKARDALAEADRKGSSAFLAATLYGR